MQRLIAALPEIRSHATRQARGESANEDGDTTAIQRSCEGMRRKFMPALQVHALKIGQSNHYFDNALSTISEVYVGKRSVIKQKRNRGAILQIK